MEIEIRNLRDIIPYARRLRHNDMAVNAVAESIRQFEWRQPIVVTPSGEIVVGEVRYKAAKKLELETVPVHVAKDLSSEQIKAYRIADNKLAELAEWNVDELLQELKDLEAAEFDLDVLGFSKEELAELFAGEILTGHTDPDDVPKPPDEPITQLGDLWLLGDHRLLCGDSGNAEHVDRLVGDVKIHLADNDPPYNVNVEPRSNNAIAAGNSSFTNYHHQQLDLARHPEKSKPTHTQMRAKDRPLENDFVSDEEFDRLLHAWFGNIARVLEPGRAFYIWGGYSNCANYPPVLKANKLYFSQAIIWVKEWPVIGRKDYMGAHEWCFYGWKEGATHKFFGPKNATDVWSIKKINPNKMIHLTEKPVELSLRAIKYSSRAGENVLDLFAGSGSTLIAAEKTGRKAFLMEIDPWYCDTIVQRWEEFTGKKATR